MDGEYQFKIDLYYRAFRRIFYYTRQARRGKQCDLLRCLKSRPQRLQGTFSGHAGFPGSLQYPTNQRVPSTEGWKKVVVEKYFPM